MPFEFSDRQPVDAIVARAQHLAASSPPDDAESDAEVFSALAGGTLSLAETDDATLERLVRQFGSDAIVRAILAASDAPRFGNRSVDPSELSPESGLSSGGARPAAGERVAGQSVRRAAFRPGVSTVMAMAASISLVALTGALLVSQRWGGGQAPALTGATAPSAELTPRLQAASSEGAGRSGPIGEAANRVAVLVSGNDCEAAAQAESILLRSLAGQPAFRALDAESLSVLRRNQAAVQAAATGDFAPLASIGRARGVELIVIGELSVRAVAVDSQGFAGSASLRARAYRVSEKRMGTETTLVAGSTDTPRALMSTEGLARLRAAEEVATQAAEEVSNWLLRPVP